MKFSRYPTRTYLVISIAMNLFAILILLVYLKSSFGIIYLSDVSCSENSTTSSSTCHPPLFYEWRHPTCRCPRYFPFPPFNRANRHVRSTCGPAADERGPHQRVLAFSFFGDTKSHYFQGIERNARAISNLYPGWTMRLYHSIPLSRGRADNRTSLCDIICENPNLDDCYVPDLENQFENISSKHGVFWRFSTMADPMVDLTCSRDLDSTVYQREVDAVNEWLDSNKTWHVMRDNIHHVDLILAGMWGVKNAANRSLIASFWKVLLETTIKRAYLDDQILLAKLVFPKAINDMLTHDSFLCKKFNNTSPFPTQRHMMTFVGDKSGVSIDKECPVECRPPAHKDWIYC